MIAVLILGICLGTPVIVDYGTCRGGRRRRCGRRGGHVRGGRASEKLLRRGVMCTSVRLQGILCAQL